MLFLVQDGITNGAIYALLGLALVLVFAVTRVILIPQGEFVTYGALTYASLASGQMPGTAKLAVAMGVAAFAFDLFAARRSLLWQRVAQAWAFLQQRPFVTPDDVQEVALPVLGVRLGVATEDAHGILRQIVESVPVPV